jgi:hypothetical protein
MVTALVSLNETLKENRTSACQLQCVMCQSLYVVLSLVQRCWPYPRLPVMLHYMLLCLKNSYVYPFYFEADDESLMTRNIRLKSVKDTWGGLDP